MSRTITDVDTLQEFIKGVMARAEHHAQTLDEVILAVAGAIIWRKDDNDLEVFERQGHMSNVLWVHIGGQRYAFSYNRRTVSIEVRLGSTQGAPVASFTNSTSTREVKEAFARL
jgi:hypothetical protein